MPGGTHSKNYWIGRGVHIVPASEAPLHLVATEAHPKLYVAWQALASTDAA